MPILPEFTPDGLLPRGDYELTLDEIRQSMLVAGPADKKLYPDWDCAWRAYLVDNLAILVGQLWRVEITDIFVDGSFVEDKDHPNDIDGYFNCGLAKLMSGRLEQELNLLDPYKVWTWDRNSRRLAPGYWTMQLPMWHRYRVELYPHVPGGTSGIVDKYGNELEFPAAFRQSRRDGKPKGIIKIRR